MSRSILLVAVLTLTALPLVATAQEFRFDQKYIETVKKASDVAAVSVDSFGDQTDIESGATTFRWTDIDIAGNNSLPVRLQRALVIEDKVHSSGGDLPGFGAGGNIDVPYLKGVFGPDGWVVTGANPTARCTNVANPPPVYGGGAIQADDYWGGNWLHVPWAGDQAMLTHLDPAAPKPSASTPSITKNFWAFSCLAATKNGYPGEAFLATSPSGEKYYFDYVVAKGYPGMSKRYGNYAHATASISRLVVYFLVSRIEDRFGNWVNYAYSGDKLSSITSNDGRFINLTWGTDGRVSAATSSLGNWAYAYTSTGLTTTQPDGAHWTYAATGALEITPTPSLPLYNGGNPDFCPMPDLSDGSYSLAVTQPSGATATFDFEVLRHSKANIPKLCNSFIDDSLMSYKYLTVPNFSDSFTLVTKTITGLGLTPMQWAYSYSGGGFNAFKETCDDPNATSITCPPTKATTVNGPGNSYKKYTFGNMFDKNYGLLVHVDEGSQVGANAPTVLKITDSTYFSADDDGTQPFAYCLGTPGSWRFDNTASSCLQPVKVKTLVQDGVTFTASNTAFDKFARATTTVRSNTLGYSKTDATTYADHIGLWVLGQVARQTSNGIEVSATTFDVTTGLPKTVSSFGKLKETIGYNLTTGDQDGTVASVTDGNGNTTAVSNWKRGIPQNIAYADGTSIAAAVDDAGLIQWVEDENDYRTCYGYDPMGRVSSITYPSEAGVHACATSGWNQTAMTFKGGNAAAYGVPAGHWRYTTLTDRGRKLVIYDALWRPIVEQSLDLDDVPNTTTEVVKRYDASGHLEFQSYPMNTVGQAIWTDPSLKGTHTKYDALDRVTEVDQDSDLGTLITKTAYLSSFRTQVTNPRGFSTITGFLAFDEPTSEWPIDIDAADGKAEEIDTDIQRDIFGKPNSITRHNPSNSVTETRGYEYDANRQLCRLTEPETGTTLMGYDNAGNLAWSAGGLPTSTVCANAGTTAVQAVKATRAYDKRNRLTSIAFVDGLADATFGYTPDGQLATSTALNGGGDLVTTSYGYNHRRLLTSERLQYGATDWSLGYGYDRNGKLATQRYPTGLTVDYAPNALGQPTQAGAYASGVSYYPNGGMKQFTYGNGIVHTLTQNMQGMADRSRDAYGTTAVLDDSYDYDPNGNVKAISDGLVGARGNRDMTYDGQDRLLTTISPMFNGVVATYSYDALDNLTAVKAPGRNQVYAYDTRWQLSNVRNAVSGATEIGLNFDGQGNLLNKNGTQFGFDRGNRLRAVDGSLTSCDAHPHKACYSYDAQGLRVRDTTIGTKLSFYSKAGQLLYTDDARAGSKTHYIYLNGSLVAQDSNVPAVGIPTLTVPSQSATGSYTVGWSASPTGNRYELQRQDNGGTFAPAYDGTGYSLDESKGNGIYGYRVRACIDAACGSWSPISSVEVSQVPASAPNLKVPALGTNGSYTITWDSVPLATEYVLAESGDGWATMTVPYDGPGLTAGFTSHVAGNFAYHVRACNSAGCSDDSADGVVQVLYAPATPGLTVPSISYTGGYTVIWTTVANGTTYKLEQSVDAGAHWTTVYSGSATSQVFSGKGTGSYVYRVSAWNSAGWSAASGPKTIQVTLVPGTAPTVTAPAVNRTGGYSVSWTSVSTATSYKLEENANKGAGWVQVYSGTALSVALSGRAQGNYDYRATACNAAGCGAPSSTAVRTVVDFTPPTPTLTAPGTTSTLSFTLSWTASSGATSYVLETDHLAPYWKSIYTGTALSFVQGGQPNQTTWGYRISACNSYGCSAPSPVKNVTIDKQTGCTTCLRAPTTRRQPETSAKRGGR